jgi:cellulose synthase/poly-beta-1,6-N-acetylglucosamine synthase-like glycosyltransferase
MMLSVLFFLIYFSVFTVMVCLLLREDWEKTVPFSGEKVKVSIMIAARNEENTIGRCLDSIAKLNYPAHLLEVLIGDDNSEDNTRQVVEKLIQDKPNFKLIQISDKLGSAKGKSNVLAHLTRLATSDYFFITDADIAVPENWILAMLARVTNRIGIVTGITTVSDHRFFSRMQGLDWLNALGLIQVVSDRNLPVTTMGNNMLVTRKAYESTGGYENFPFSITEDIQLFNEVLNQGFGFKNVYQKETLAISLPAKSLPDLLQQRKRWLKGVTHLPHYMKAVLVLYASFYAVMIPFFFQAPFFLAFGILFLKWLYQSFFLQTCLKRVKRRASLTELFLFEEYQILISLLLLIFYYLPVKVNWKGRKY